MRCKGTASEILGLKDGEVDGLACGWMACPGLCRIMGDDGVWKSICMR